MGGWYTSVLISLVFPVVASIAGEDQLPYDLHGESKVVVFAAQARLAVALSQSKGVLLMAQRALQTPKACTRHSKRVSLDAYTMQYPPIAADMWL